MTPRGRLLVITFHYPPDGSVGGLRWAGLSKYLARLGWEVHVITAANQYRETPVDGVYVHGVERAKTLNDVYTAYQARRQAPASGALPRQRASGPPAEAHRGRAGMLGRIRDSLATSLVLPDNARGWLTRMGLRARRQLRQAPFDAIVVSGPPHSSHIIGALLARSGSPRLFVDMRDPWSISDKDGSRRVPFNSSLMRVLMPRLERFVFNRADAIVSNSAEFADALRISYPRLDIRYIPNGVDPDRLVVPRGERRPGVTIGYAGTLYGRRSVTSVLKAMRSFLGDHPDAANALRLRIAGMMDAAHADTFGSDVREAKLETAVEFLGRVSPAEALELLAESNIALVLAQNQPMQVPAKLYECVGMRVPTLAIAEASSATYREALRIGAAVREPDDIDGIAKVIEQAWIGALHPPDSIAAIDYARIADEWHTLLLAAG